MEEEFVLVWLKGCRSRWFSGYRACHLTQGSQVQTQPRTMDFLRAIKTHSTTSFWRELKPSALCCKILWHVKDPCGVWQRYFAGKINEYFSLSLSLCFATRSLYWYLRESLGGWIMNDYNSDGDTTIDQKMPAVHGTPCTIPTRNCNQQLVI
jgi:hypothetical protein